MALQLLLLLLLWGLPGVLLLVLLHVTRGLPAGAAAAFTTTAAWPGLRGCPPVGTGLLQASSCRSESVWAAPGARCASANSPEVGHLGMDAVRSARQMPLPSDSWSRSSAPPGSALQQHTQHGFVTWALAVWCHQWLARRGAWYHWYLAGGHRCAAARLLGHRVLDRLYSLQHMCKLCSCQSLWHSEGVGFCPTECPML